MTAGLEENVIYSRSYSLLVRDLTKLINTRSVRKEKSEVRIMHIFKNKTQQNQLGYI